MKVFSVLALLSCLVSVNAESGAVASPGPKRYTKVLNFNAPAKEVEPVKTVKTLSKKTAVTASLILAFNCGFSNGACLGGGLTNGVTKGAVSAVTGAWTTNALSFAGGNKKAFQNTAKSLASYMSGSAVAGMLNPNPTPFQLGSNIPLTFMVGAALMAGASTLAGSNPSSMAPLFLALMANGVCNSVTSVHTGNLCRTAHFSGITSDMGTFLGQIIMGNKANLFKLQVFVGLAAFFWMGGVAAFFLTKELGTNSLMISAVLNALTGLSSLAI